MCGLPCQTCRKTLPHWGPRSETVGVQSVPDQCEWNIGNVGDFRNSKPKIIVLGAREAVAITAERLHQLGTKHDGRMNEWIVTPKDLTKTPVLGFRLTSTRD